jgi:hypothetical protein
MRVPPVPRLWGPGRRALTHTWRLYSVKRDLLVRCSSLSLERHSRPPVRAVAQRVSALARRNLLRQKSRNAHCARHLRFCLGFALGARELSRLGRASQSRPPRDRPGKVIGALTKLIAARSEGYGLRQAPEKLRGAEVLKGHGFSRAERSPLFLSLIAGFGPREIGFDDSFRTSSAPERNRASNP